MITFTKGYKGEWQLKENDDEYKNWMTKLQECLMSDPSKELQISKIPHEYILETAEKAAKIVTSKK